MARLPLVVVLIAFAAGFAPGQSLPSAITLVGGLHALALRESAKLPDPFPIRRVLLPENAPLPVAPDGDPFRKMSREEFERLVRAAARNVPANPKLARAEYRATLTDDSLAGTGEWLFASDSDGSFALEPLRIAVRGAKWADGREATIAGSPAKLWVERRGRPAVAFDWSARGAEEPGAVRFNLGVPAAPLAVLELELPADRIPTAKSGALLAGPIARPGNRAAWRFAFGGESTLEFAVRLPAAGRPAPFATFARTAKVDLSPGLASIACDFEIAPLRDAPSSLEFLIDGGLVVSEVSAVGLANWRVEGPRLLLAFREPFAGGKVAVAAVAPLPADGQPWTVPNVHPAAGSTTVDLVELLVGPDLKWEGCAPGDYRAIRTSTSDRGLALSLRGTLPAEGHPKRQSPSLRLRGAGAEFATVETLDWRIEPDRTHLTARIRAAVTRGPLARLVVRVPPGVTPFAAVVAPDDPTATLTALGDNLWAIEPTQPVPAGESLDVRLELRGPAPKFDAAGTAALVLENPSPVGATKRDGSATVKIASNLRGWLSHPAGDPSESGTLSFKYIRDEAIQLALARRKIPEPDRPEPASPKAVGRGWQFSDLEATATVDPDGAVRVELAGRIRSAVSRTLPVTLPPAATVESARIEGKWADLATADGTARLPVPEPDADGIAFVLAYRLPPSGSWNRSIAEFRPELPDAPPIRARLAAGPHFRAWPTLDETTDSTAILIPARWLIAAGFGLAAILFGFAVAQFLREPVSRMARSFAFLAVAALGSAAWLAPPGWLAVVGPPLAVALVGLIAMNLRTGRAAALALALLPAGTGVAQAPAVATVYFLAESPDDPNRLAALVPRSVLDRLAALAAPHRPALLLTDAEYAGSEADGVARFDATWRIDVTRAGVHEFELPLAGVKLDGMTLDGAAAFPDAAKPGRYKLMIAGVGSHVLKAAFAVPTTTNGGDREARFGIPDLPSTRVSLALPASGRTPELVGRTGGQAVVREGERSLLKADIGPGTALAIRWRDAAAAAPVATVLEATVWDVNETRAEAVAAFLHRVERGALSRLVFDLPAGLEPGQFAVRELDAPAGSSNGLKDWTLESAPAGTRLTLVLRQPARGQIATTFRLVPREGPTARPTLAVPRAATGDVTASYLGVRLAGVAAEAWQNQNLIDVPADAVGREFAALPDFEFDRTLARSLRREGPNVPLARPTLRTPASPVPVSNELIWSLGSRAEVVGSAQWTGTALPVVECDLPAGVTVADVSAADLAAWERAGNRLRVWFKSDVRDPSVKWTGHWPAFDPANAVELPAVAGSTVRVRPVEGAALTVANLPAAKLLATARPRERAYLADPAAVPKFRVYPPVAPLLKQTETLTRVGNLFEHRAFLDVPLAANRPYAFTLSVANLPPGAEPRVEWPAGAAGVETAGAANRRTWLVDLVERPEPGTRIAVVTRFAVRPDPQLPTVELLSGHVPLARAEHRLALPDDLRPVPGSARRAANAWDVVSEGPIRLVDVAAPNAIVIPPDPGAESLVEYPTTGDSRAWFAAAWLTGLLIVVMVANGNSSKWRPEVLIGFGVLATAVAGWAFAPIAVVGLSMRLIRTARSVGRRVIR